MVLGLSDLDPDASSFSSISTLGESIAIGHPSSSPFVLSSGSDLVFVAYFQVTVESCVRTPPCEFSIPSFSFCFHSAAFSNSVPFYCAALAGSSSCFSLLLLVVCCCVGRISFSMFCNYLAAFCNSLCFVFLSFFLPCCFLSCSLNAYFSSPNPEIRDLCIVHVYLLSCACW
ncbi:hypothetical protein RDI58_018194 [Solanum bulbocastanum]|uniref:Uncharacterized protein n=1 Tax=Solanum bulbocastanum TaxID=147425 RepID=A0AAN8TB61_SOLBU